MVDDTAITGALGRRRDHIVRQEARARGEVPAL
jgi:hypothetical protein